MASELLRITDPHLVHYSSQQLAWVDANNGQAAPLHLLRTLHDALGTPAMGALHQLLECRASSAAAAAVQLCRAELSSGETRLLWPRADCHAPLQAHVAQPGEPHHSFHQGLVGEGCHYMELWRAPGPEAGAVE